MVKIEKTQNSELFFTVTFTNMTEGRILTILHALQVYAPESEAVFPVKVMLELEMAKKLGEWSIKEINE